MFTKKNAVTLLVALTATANALAQAEQAAPQPNPIASFAPFLIIFAIFYFMMIRPQKRRMQEEQNMLGALTKGDEIYTKSGLIGVITGLTDKIVTLEVSEGVKLKIVRSQIGGLAKQLFENKPDASNNKVQDKLVKS